MLDNEKKIEILDFVVLFGLIIVSCLTGKLVMDRVDNSLLSFNVPAIGVLVVGELIWLKARGMLQERRNVQEGREKKHE